MYANAQKYFTYGLYERIIGHKEILTISVFPLNRKYQFWINRLL